MTTFNLESFLRPALGPVQPYQVPHIPEAIRLDANENPYPCPPEIREELGAILGKQSFNRYPDSAARELRGALAAYVGRDPDEILVGNGSDELIQLLLLTFGGEGTRSVIPVPTFVMYKMATLITGGEAVEVPLDENFALDAEAMIRAAQDPRVKVVFLVNPNNPTANAFPQEELLRVVAEAGKLVIMDEAYYEFCGQSLIPMLERYPNLVVMRTFSKAFGLAGLRIGYLVGNRQLISYLHKARQPFNLNTFSQQAAVVALRHLPYYQAVVREILKERDCLLAQLKDLPLERVYPSQANFILFKTRGDAGQVYRSLAEKGILVRALGGHPALERTLRVTVGQPEENRAFLKALREMLQ